MPVPDDEFAEWVDMDWLKSQLPPGYSLWWIRGKVLHTEIIDRPYYQSGPTGPMPSGQTNPDTLITVADVHSNQPLGLEIRLLGRTTDYQVGDTIELFGHQAPNERRYFPRAAGSFKTGQWDYAYAPTRPGAFDFPYQFIIPSRQQVQRGITMLSNDDDMRMKWFKVPVTWQGAPFATATPAAQQESAPTSNFGIIFGMIALMGCVILPNQHLLNVIGWVGLPALLWINRKKKIVLANGLSIPALKPWQLLIAVLFCGLPILFVPLISKAVQSIGTRDENTGPPLDLEPTYREVFAAILSQSDEEDPSATDGREPLSVTAADDHNLPPM